MFVHPQAIDASETCSSAENTAHAVSGPAAAPSTSISPSHHLPIISVMVVGDLVGAAVATKIMWPSIDTAWPLIIAAGSLIPAARLAGLYNARCSGDLRRSTLGTLSLFMVSLAVALMSLWVTDSSYVGLHVVLALMAAFACAILGRLVCALAVFRWSNRLIERVFVVGTPERTGTFVRSGLMLNKKVKIVGQILVRDVGSNVQGIRATSGFQEDTRAGHTRLQDHDAIEADVAGAVLSSAGVIDRVLILRSGFEDHHFQSTLRALDACSLPIHVLTDTSADGRSAGAAWALSSPPARAGAMLAKRMFDIAVSSIALVFVAPMLVVLGVIVRLESPGPALFRQTRLGRNHKPFTVLKLRTMRSDAPATDGSVQAMRGDPRVTRVGAILRKTSLDEMPQLINVFGGSMSLVGPRPHPTELNRKFAPLIERYSARHRVAPGITGWAQVNGFRGETRTTEQMRRRVELDLEYIGGHTVAWDVWIILRTVVAVINSRNAY